MLTTTPTPSQPSAPIKLHRGFNLVTLCLVMTASLVRSSMFSNPLWLEGNEVCSGVQVVSGPISQTCISSQSVIPEPPSALNRNYPKCRPSRMLPEPEQPPKLNGVLVSQPPSELSDLDLPDFSTVFYTTVLVRSTKHKAVLPHNVKLGTIRPQTSDNEATFLKAAETTAKQLADTWFEYASSVQSAPVCAVSKAQPTSTSLRNCKVSDQFAEMQQSGLDSSILSPLLPEPDIDHPNLFPPTSDVRLDPHSEEYYQKLVEALELDTQAYFHVNPEIMTQFKALIRKYPTAFHLPGAELRPVTGFHHNISTGDSPPVYRMPYRKSPAELTAIKEELKRMLKLHIIQPSHSEWGAPCIQLIRKPPEKGVPQPPRFVVDYRGLNKVTVGDGYPIPSVSNILDALSGGKLFGKLDLASGYWQVLVNPQHVHKTAFSTHLGLYEFVRMPYGLKTAPQTFQRILNSIFSDMLYNWLIIYIDDLIVWSDNETKALQHYDRVFQCAIDFGIQFKPTKCAFFFTGFTGFRTPYYPNR